MGFYFSISEYHQIAFHVEKTTSMHKKCSIMQNNFTNPVYFCKEENNIGESMRGNLHTLHAPLRGKMFSVLSGLGLIA